MSAVTTWEQGQLFDPGPKRAPTTEQRELGDDQLARLIGALMADRRQRTLAEIEHEFIDWSTRQRTRRVLGAMVARRRLVRLDLRADLAGDRIAYRYRI